MTYMHTSTRVAAFFLVTIFFCFSCKKENYVSTSKILISNINLLNVEIPDTLFINYKQLSRHGIRIFSCTFKTKKSVQNFDYRNEIISKDTIFVVNDTNNYKYKVPFYNKNFKESYYSCESFNISENIYSAHMCQKIRNLYKKERKYSFMIEIDSTIIDSEINSITYFLDNRFMVDSIYVDYGKVGLVKYMQIN